MAWLPKERMDEWLQEELVQEHRARWEAQKTKALQSLRVAARTLDLAEVRRAEARVAMIEEFLKDYEDEEEEQDE